MIINMTFLFILLRHCSRFRFFFPPPAGALAIGSWGVGALATPFGVSPRAAVGTGVVALIPEPTRVSVVASSIPVSNA